MPLYELRGIMFWVERSSKQCPWMWHHESYEWWSDNGVKPDKPRGVELSNTENFLTWTKDQPWMVMHELAHGYHTRVLGGGHPGIKHFYETAKPSKNYDSVLEGVKRERHYPINNEKEYFAGVSEAISARMIFNHSRVIS